MVTGAEEQKITYTTMGVEQAEAFHARFSDALQRVRRDLGQEFPAYVGDEPVTTGREPFKSWSPNDSRIVIGTFQECRQPEVEAAVRAAKSAYRVWSRTPWKERVTVLRGAARLFRERKYDMAAQLTLEAGKARLEAMGEVEEAADLLDAYCDYLTDRDGFVLRLEQLRPEEVNYSVLKPYGVWAVVAPFNFPIALATGMLAGVLVTGNVAIFKPSHETPLAGVRVYECLRDAGLPPGAINLLTGYGNETGELLSAHPGIDGIAFTGSKAVGTHIYSEFSRRTPRPCITEMGGKNPVIVTERAHLGKAVEGTVRAAFGYSGQKCSAASRVYVQEGVRREFLDQLVARTAELQLGDPSDATTFLGPVINESAYRRFQGVAATAATDGEVLIGGSVAAEGNLQYGYYCRPTLAALPPDHRFFYDELFVPFTCIAGVASLEEAVERANDSEYGLTAGIFTEDPDEARYFQDNIEAGVTYVNRGGGATTGAWPKIQSFGGWKASGSPGKSALGPYYIEQFLREQTQTVVYD